MSAYRETLLRVGACVAGLFLAIQLSAQQARWDQLNAKVQMLQIQGKFADAISLAKESLQVAETTLDKNSPYIGVSFDTLATLYKSQGDYAEAEQYYKRCVAFMEKTMESGDPNLAAARNNLAELYRTEGRYREAEPLFRQALEVLEKYPDRGPDWAASLSNLGLVYRAQGRYAEAQKQDDLALEIRERLFGGESSEVADSLNNLGQLRRDQGKYGEAAILYQRAMNIYTKLSGSDSPDIADTVNNLGALYADQGMYADAEQYYRRALAIDQKTSGDQHPVATDFNNLAALYHLQGKYGEAEQLYRRALSIDESAIPTRNPFAARDLANLALVCQEQGKYSEAEQYYQKALDIDMEVLGKDHPDVAKLLNNLAGLSQDLGQADAAEPLYKNALTIDENALGKDHPDVARDLNNLGEFYLVRGKFQVAEPYFHQALDIEQKTLDKGSPFQAFSLANLAMVYQSEEKYAEAESFYQRALAMAEETLGKDQFGVTKLLHNFATLYYAQGKYAQASPVWDRSLGGLQRQFETQFAYMSEKDRLSFLATAASEFPLYSSFCFTYREQSPELAGKLYNLLLWQKGLVVNGIAAVRSTIVASGDKDALAQFEKLTTQRAQLAELRNPPPNNLELWRQKVDELEEQSNELETSLVQRFRTLEENRKLARASWQEVQKALGPDEAAVEFVRFKYHDGKQWSAKSYYIALVVSAQTHLAPDLVVLGEGNELEKKALADYQDRVGALRPDPNSGRLFYQAYWKPLEAKLAGMKKVYVSPDGVLNQISWAAVPTDDGGLLADRYDVDVVLSTKDLLRERHTVSDQSAVLIGNPKFDLDETGQRAAVAALEKNRQQSSGGGPAQVSSSGEKKSAEGWNPSVANVAPSPRSPDAQGGPLDPLPGTEVELESIRGLLRKKGWQMDIYSRELALEEAIKHVNHPRLLHVATHGFFEPDQELPNRDVNGAHSGLEDPMLRSGLFFAGADRARTAGQPVADLDDGVLTAYEATGLNLQGTELVVLSACETGLGKVANGEGVFGLRRALQEAGAEAVLMSMWSVPDEETQELMAFFYEKWLSGQSKHDALSDAQQELRKALRARWGEAPPYYWAAFVLVGR